MLKTTELFYFYRIINWQNKISGMRSLGYSVLGYLMAGHLNLPFFFLNSLIIIGWLMLVFSLNDYFDWKVQKEKNFLSSKITKRELSEKQALFYIFLPLLLCLFLIIESLISWRPIFFFILFSLVVLFYTLPSIRLKRRKILGFLVSPITVSLIFLQSYFIFGRLNLDIIFLTVLIFLFHCYLEVLHALEDSLAPDEITRISSNQALKLLKAAPLISLFISLLFAFYNPIFFISSFFALIRIISLKKFRELVAKEKLTIQNIQSVRRNFLSLQLSLYEFLIYGALGALYR